MAAAGNAMVYVTRGNQTVNTPQEPKVNQTEQPSVGNTETESPIDSQLYNENTESAENLQGMPDAQPNANTVEPGVNQNVESQSVTDVNNQVVPLPESPEQPLYQVVPSQSPEQPLSSGNQITIANTISENNVEEEVLETNTNTVTDYIENVPGASITDRPPETTFQSSTIQPPPTDSASTSNEENKATTVQPLQSVIITNAPITEYKEVTVPPSPQASTQAPSEEASHVSTTWQPPNTTTSTLASITTVPPPPLPTTTHKATTKPSTTQSSSFSQTQSGLTSQSQPIDTTEIISTLPDSFTPIEENKQTGTTSGQQESTNEIIPSASESTTQNSQITKNTTTESGQSSGPEHTQDETQTVEDGTDIATTASTPWGGIWSFLQPGTCTLFELTNILFYHLNIFLQ